MLWYFLYLEKVSDPFGTQRRGEYVILRKHIFTVVFWVSIQKCITTLWRKLQTLTSYSRFQYSHCNIPKKVHRDPNNIYVKSCFTPTCKTRWLRSRQRRLYWANFVIVSVCFCCNVAMSSDKIYKRIKQAVCHKQLVKPGLKCSYHLN